MNNSQMQILHIPQSIKDDTLSYRRRVKTYLDGQTSPVAFRAYRVPMGVYEQRTTGKFMVRIRIGAGLALPHQVGRIAQLSKNFGNGIVHVTTRQDIQIHDVDIEDTPDILEGLLEAGLSSRGGGGNTVRNVTACPEAGVCHEEQFDVAPYAIAAAEYLLQDRSSFNLPRKYKVVFSGCSKDCAFASIADLGFFAHKKNGTKGFSVYAAGGLGANPATAAKIEDFIEADEIFAVAEAVKRLFDKHGDRSNKHKARLRYVLSRVGIEEFLKLYKLERDKLKAEGLPYTAPKIRDISSVYKVPEKSVNVRLWLKKGDIPADDLGKVGQIAAEYGQGLVRTTQLQDLLITGVSEEDIDKVNKKLKELSIDVSAESGSAIVACAGASTCKLGLCLSRGLADAISDRFSRSGLSADLSRTAIRISGCPNSCGHHYICEIGLQGKAKRVNGKLMPCYDVLVGAKTVEGDARLGKRIGTVPAKKIPDLLTEAFESGEINRQTLKDLIERYGEFSSKKFPDDYYYDFGSDEPFSLAGRGPGECGAGVMDVMKLDIDEAKDALKSGPAGSENIYRAVVAAARALLFTFGIEPKKDREILSAFAEKIIEPGWVKPRTKQLLNDAIDWRMGDKESIEDLSWQAEELTKRIEELYLSLDANLRFKIEPVVRKDNVDKDENEKNIVDLRGVGCPLNFVKAKLELEKIRAGDILDILLDSGEPVRNVPASFADQGQEVLQVKSIGDHFCVKVRRKK
jgi:sulfite reductase (ferredoxin)